METCGRMGAGTHPVYYPWPRHPGYTHPCYRRTRGHGCAGSVTRLKGAMGSKKALRNSQNRTEVNLRRTICLLAHLLEPCCKNRPSPKAPDYLHLSNPYSILSRVRTLP